MLKLFKQSREFTSTAILILSGVLIFLMPLHNLIVQYSTKILKFPVIVSAWKDIVLVLLILFILIHIRKSLFKLRVSYPLLLVLIINLCALLSSFIFNPVTDIKAFIFGYYFEIWWVNVFGFVVTWLNYERQNQIDNKENNKFKELKTQWSKYFSYLFISSFIIVAIISLLANIFGQEKILGFFGYGVATTENALVGTSLVCHQVDYQIDICRSSGTFSHPIHFGGYLIFVLPIFLCLFTVSSSYKSKIFYIILILINMYLAFISGTRYYILGSIGILTVFILYHIKSSIKLNINLLFSKVIFTIILLISTLGGLAFMTINPDYLLEFLPANFVKPSSTIWHYRHTMAALDIIKESNSDGKTKILTGFGIGQIGSSGRDKYQDLTKNTIVKDYGYVAYRWVLLPEPMLLTENWILQTIINGGLIYSAFYWYLVLIPIIYALIAFYKAKIFTHRIYLYLLIGMGFLGVFIGNLLQHLWENQTLVWYWIAIWIWVTFQEND
jgi:hypothetical protein